MLLFNQLQAQHKKITNKQQKNKQRCYIIFLAPRQKRGLDSKQKNMDCRVIPLSFAVGFFGDLAVQILPHGEGLREYFALHGRFEAMLIAGGALACVFSLYYLTRLDFTLWAVVGLGIAIDVVARLGLIPSLKHFYQSTGVIASILSAGILPVLLVWVAQAVFLRPS